jgi:NAD(P)H-hydrate epimerase
MGMKIVSVEEMREIERRAAEIGLPPQVLMENAGLKVAEEVREWLGDVKGRHILALIGPGNNGGDGLVAARHLHDWGAKVWLYLCGSRDADSNYRLAQERGISSAQATGDDGFAALESILPPAEAIIDALFGTGKARPLRGVYPEVLNRAKREKKARPSLQIIALDLPSGLNPDTGAVDPACLTTDATITLGYPKLGLFAFPGAETAGKVIVADIGIPLSLAEDIPTELINPEWVRGVLPQRPPEANKGNFGRVLVVAGSINYIGAVYLACSGAIRVGAGLVTLATARSLQPILASKLTETTYIPLPESETGVIGAEAAPLLTEEFGSYDVLLLGCGLGQRPSVREFAQAVLFQRHSPLALVVDADALNTLAGTPQWWREVDGNAILTPHPGEMARLTGLPVSDIQSDRVGVARTSAIKWGKTVVLKGAHTVVAAPDGQVRVSSFANPGLASAGTGDVLSGAIAGLVAQGLRLFDAAACGVYLHGAAGELVKGDLGDTGMIASDLLPALPLAIKGVKEEACC